MNNSQRKTPKNFFEEYWCDFSSSSKEINLKENINMEERLNKFLEENNIEVDEYGNFEAYVVVDADDKDHEIGSIICGKETEVYTEDRAYEDLKENYYKGNLLNIECLTYYPFRSYSQNYIKKQTTIRENLLKLEDKMFKILVNKENVVNVGKINSGAIMINKYRVIESIELKPVLKFKIKSINKNTAEVLLYNSLTEKSKTITVKCDFIDSIEDVGLSIRDYLEENERQVALINSIIDDGAEL